MAASADAEKILEELVTDSFVSKVMDGRDVRFIRVETTSAAAFTSAVGPFADHPLQDRPLAAGEVALVVELRAGRRASPLVCVAQSPPWPFSAALFAFPFRSSTP